MEASWPSKRLAAVTKRSGLAGDGVDMGASIARAAREGARQNTRFFGVSLDVEGARG